jgi:hypothetical protein
VVIVGAGVGGLVKKKKQKKNKKKTSLSHSNADLVVLCVSAGSQAGCAAVCSGRKKFGRRQSPVDEISFGSVFADVCGAVSQH